MTEFKCVSFKGLNTAFFWQEIEILVLSERLSYLTCRLQELIQKPGRSI